MKTKYDDWSDKWGEVIKSYADSTLKVKMIKGGNSDYLRDSVYCSDDDIKEEINILYDNNSPPS